MPPLPSTGLEASTAVETRPVSAVPSCSVLVVSCDRYRDLWPPFFHLFWKYWPGCPFPVYLGANSATWHGSAVRTLHAGRDESWSKSLKFFLSQIPSRYVLLLLEDFFLDGPISSDRLLRHLETLAALDGTVLRLLPNPPPDLPIENHPAIGQIHRLAAFRVSAQPGIWNRTALMAVLRDDESPWDFEHLGTVRSQADSRGYFCTRAASLPCRHVVERGKWFRPAARYYRKLDIGCDFAARPAMSALTAVKKLAAQRLRSREMPPFDRLRVAFLTNLIPPYHKPVLDCVARRYGSLRVLLSTPMEANRPWKLEWQGLDVVVQKTWTLAGSWRHPGGFSEPLRVHLPLDTFAQLRRYRPHVVISGEMGMRTLLAALYRKFNRRSRLIVWAEVSEATERGRGLLRRVIRPLLCRHADAFLAVGSSGARYLRSLGVGAAKIFPLRYSSGVEQFSANDIARPPERAHRLLYTGQLVERKGLLPFLETLSKWAAAHPERSVEFVVVGSGPLRSALETFAAPVNLELRLHASLPYEDLPRIYSEAGLFVLPTLADSWGVVVNEALAAGLPVLGSVRAQAVKELLEDGKNGWTFEPGRPEEIYSAIDRAMTASCGQLDTMRAYARSTALALTPDDTARLIDDAIAASVKTG
jgi:glycosyltransferase involved in cell wall biosynthesis